MDTHMAASEPPLPGKRTPALAIVPPVGNVDEDWSATLCALAQQQDLQAFARLFAHFAPRVKRYLMLAGCPEAQADELSQEALAAVWRKAALFDPARAAASTWIFTIARHLRVDAMRRRQGLGEAESLDAAAPGFELADLTQPTADDRLHAQQQHQRLRRAFALLSPQHRQLLNLSYYDEAPHTRIAAELGIPLGTVKSRIRVAVAQLRRLLE
ncbi:sigma-70 family RNA polymerase sigma factor [Paucibacter sp. R3-3]|uniref:Sigma-70 family RNA polymerase sigma factor n=1 Tax=Roseateles agri TaxID=3098619 RepID=A0ABU5DNS4_9BURK|nr:sigma-70 family RNA polymerase sigma factor [Paucibacter sp. R3-3]MDY0747970.1 sigma-70 family RNA polymerase sigma factor [Paucibacter sp. R3-3]